MFGRWMCCDATEVVACPVTIIPKAGKAQAGPFNLAISRHSLSAAPHVISLSIIMNLKKIPTIQCTVQVKIFSNCRKEEGYKR